MNPTAIHPLQLSTLYNPLTASVHRPTFHVYKPCTTKE